MNNLRNLIFSLSFCIGAVSLFAQDEYQSYATLFEEVEKNIQSQVAMWQTEEMHTTKMSYSGEIEVIGYYQDGLAIVRYQNKYGFINKYGQYAVAPDYQELHLFVEGFAPAKYNGKWSFVNTKGEILAPFVYEYVGIFNLGLAAVQRNGKWGVINQTGVEIVEPIYDAIEIDQNGEISYLAGIVWRKIAR